MAYHWQVSWVQTHWNLVTALERSCHLGNCLANRQQQFSTAISISQRLFYNSNSTYFSLIIFLKSGGLPLYTWCTQICKKNMHRQHQIKSLKKEIWTNQEHSHIIATHDIHTFPPVTQIHASQIHICIVFHQTNVSNWVWLAVATSHQATISTIMFILMNKMGNWKRIKHLVLN